MTVKLHLLLENIFKKQSAPVPLDCYLRSTWKIKMPLLPQKCMYYYYHTLGLS